MHITTPEAREFSALLSLKLRGMAHLITKTSGDLHARAQLEDNYAHYYKLKTRIDDAIDKEAELCHE